MTSGRSIWLSPKVWLGFSLAAHFGLASLIFGGLWGSEPCSPQRVIVDVSLQEIGSSASSVAQAAKDAKSEKTPIRQHSEHNNPAVSVPQTAMPTVPAEPAELVLSTEEVQPTTEASGTTPTAEPTVATTGQGTQDIISELRGGTVEENLGGGAGGAVAANLGGSTVPPTFLRRREPAYPLLAKKNGWEGTVELAVTVMTNGRPGEIVILKSSSFDVLDRSALNAAREWRFTPASQGGVPLQLKIRVPVAFILQRGNAANGKTAEKID